MSVARAAPRTDPRRAMGHRASPRSTSGTTSPSSAGRRPVVSSTHPAAPWHRRARAWLDGSRAPQARNPFLRSSVRAASIKAPPAPVPQSSGSTLIASSSPMWGICRPTIASRMARHRGSRRTRTPGPRADAPHGRTSCFGQRCDVAVGHQTAGVRGRQVRTWICPARLRQRPPACISSGTRSHSARRREVPAASPPAARMGRPRGSRLLTGATSGPAGRAPRPAADRERGRAQPDRQSAIPKCSSMVRPVAWRTPASSVPTYRRCHGSLAYPVIAALSGG